MKARPTWYRSATATRRSQKPTWSKVQAKSKPADLLHQAMEVEIVLGGVGRHRGVEKPALADVDAAEELPVALQVGMHDAIGRAPGKTLKLVVQFARAKHRQHHELVEVGAAALDADLLAHHRVAAVAAHDIVRFQNLAGGGAVLGDGDPNANSVLLDGLGGPAEAAIDMRQARHLAPQHHLHLVLRHPVVGLGIERMQQLAPSGRMPELARQAFVGGDLADCIARRHHPRGAQLVDDAPEAEMLERAVGQVLALGDAMHADAGFHQHAGYAAQSELDGERHTDRPAAHDDHLVSFAHASPLTSALHRTEWLCV